jgi:hypothetical protein
MQPKSHTKTTSILKASVPFASSRPRLRAQLLSAVLFVGCLAQSAQAQTVNLDRDIDLVTDSYLIHYSQSDPRWAQRTLYGNINFAEKTIGECGCLLAALATAINRNSHSRTMLPWFAARFYDPISGQSIFDLDFNPWYLDMFFTYGVSLPLAPYSPPEPPFTLGWGYKRGVTCGTNPLILALQLVGQQGEEHPGQSH